MANRQQYEDVGVGFAGGGEGRMRPSSLIKAFIGRESRGGRKEGGGGGGREGRGGAVPLSPSPPCAATAAAIEPPLIEPP